MLNELYPAIEAANHALSNVYITAFDASAGRCGLLRFEAFLLMTVPTFAPDPVSEKLLAIRNPYNAPDYYEKTLLELCSKGMLESVPTDKFSLTRKGLEVIKAIILSIYTALAGFQPLTEIELTELAGRLNDLADSCFNAAEPPGKWCLSHVRKMDPGAQAHPMVRIDQHLSELGAYRDDSHLAAWQGLGVGGHAWELLTLLWIEESASLEWLRKRLERRGQSLAQSHGAVNELTIKKWIISEQNDVLRITEKGRATRVAAEELTDRYFQAAFSEFSEYDLEGTIELLKRFRHGIP